MSEFPFELTIILTYPRKRTECVSCVTLLRAVLGKRKVYDAMWDNKRVVAKVFSDRISARRHLRREWRGMKRLVSFGLSAPEPLFYGHTKDGQRVMVAEKIADSSTISDIFLRTADEARKVDLLLLVCKELAKQHTRGIIQKDLHLGNFLLADDKVYALDVAQMKFLRREADRESSISQLAMLAFYLPSGKKESLAILCKEYFKARGWHYGKAHQSLLEKKLAIHRKRMVNRGLKKCMRTSRRHFRIQQNGYIAVFDKTFCGRSRAMDFMETTDKLMNQGQTLKKGNTCYVCRLRWSGKDIVVKRYNHKGFTHSLRHTLKNSRARRAWLHGHRLGMLGIPTPKPLAYIEQHRKKLTWKSYLVTEYVQGQRLHDFINDGAAPEEQHAIVIKQIEDLLEKMGRNRITHGDLKHTNILVTDDGPVLTDLDAMKAHKWSWSYKSKRTKDLQRFTKSG
jgi:tRNA A-37 threonylcarbamoyl transferase component Bud32